MRGHASGLVNTSRQVGGGIGIAVLFTLATTHSSHQIGHGTQVPQALTNGFRLGYYIGAGLTAVAAILTFVLLPRIGEKQTVTRRIQIGTAIALVLGAFVGIDFAVGGSHGAPIGAYTTNGAYAYVS